MKWREVMRGTRAKTRTPCYQTAKKGSGGRHTSLRGRWVIKHGNGHVGGTKYILGSKDWKVGSVRGGRAEQ